MGDDESPSSSSSSSSLATVEWLISSVEEISAISDYWTAYKKPFLTLARRIRLPAPMFEELKESKAPMPGPAAEVLAGLGAALESAHERLPLSSKGSKIFLVELAQTQFKRAKERIGMLDAELFNDLASVYNKSTDAKVDPTIQGRSAKFCSRQLSLNSSMNR